MRALNEANLRLRLSMRMPDGRFGLLDPFSGVRKSGGRRNSRGEGDAKRLRDSDRRWRLEEGCRLGRADLEGNDGVLVEDLSKLLEVPELVLHELSCTDYRIGPRRSGGVTGPRSESGPRGHEARPDEAVGALLAPLRSFRLHVRKLRAK